MDGGRFVAGLVWLLEVAIGSAAFAQRPSVVVVTTAEADSKDFIGKVQVSVDGRIATTDDLGEVVFGGVASGRHRVQARRLGFAPLTTDIVCTGTDTLRVTFMMRRSDQMLDTQHVREQRIATELSEFEGRRALGVGQFLTRDELDKFAGRELATHLAARFHGTRMQMGKVGGTQYLMSTQGDVNPRDGGCVTKVFLDGLRRDPDLSDIRPENLAGVEFYSVANIPAEYRSGAPCGVLLLWTRF
jgi:hypothetical protein